MRREHPMSWAMVDGELMPATQARIPVDDPAVTSGWSVFETLRAVEGEVQRLPAHLRRLEQSALAAEIVPPDTATLERELMQIATLVGGDCRLRVTLTGAGRRIVLGVRGEHGRRGRPVRAARGPHRDDPFLGGRVKHGSRAGWVVAVRRAAVDEVLLVDRQGCFTEGTTSGIVAVVDGVLFTAPDDGRILPSTTIADLVLRAEELGLEVRREGARAEGPWDGLYIASATRRLSPVSELDGQSLDCWEPIGQQLFEDGGW